MLYWIRTGSEFNDWCQWTFRNSDTHKEEAHVNAEGEIGVITAVSQEQQGFLEGRRHQEEMRSIHLQSLQKEHGPLNTLVFNLQTPKLRENKFLLC